MKINVSIEGIYPLNRDAQHSTDATSKEEPTANSSQGGDNLAVGGGTSNKEGTT